jgi:hypothetical protein
METACKHVQIVTSNTFILKYPAEAVKKHVALARNSEEAVYFSKCSLQES